MPGTTTYLDTPVLPTRAFAGPGQATLDAELSDQTPVIKSVVNTNAIGTPTLPAGSGPYLLMNGSDSERTITITSAGTAVSVPNPAYDQATYGATGDANCVPPAPNAPNPGPCFKTITRDYGFGDTPGQVFVGSTLATIVANGWSADQITAIVPANTPTGQLKIVRNLGQGNTRESVMGVTLTMAATHNATTAPKVVDPAAAASANTFSTIQAAVDGAADGGLVPSSRAPTRNWW